jgi:hypothetical protein
MDEANLSKGLKRVARHSIPASAILLPAAFFLSVLSPDTTEPNALIYLAYLGAVSLTAGLLLLGIGLFRSGRARRDSAPETAGSDAHPVKSAPTPKNAETP